MDEPALVNETFTGNIDSFHQLVLEHQKVVFNVAFRVLYDEELAEDATQNAFLSANKNLVYKATVP